MDIELIVKDRVLKHPGLIKETAAKLGINDSALYARLKRGQRTDNLIQMVGAMGGTIYIKFEDKTYKLTGDK